MIPERFGKYVLLERLAFGGMAEIFAASLKGAEGFEKRLVIKRILPQFSSDPSFVKMFIDEALIAANLSHPNIVQVYDFGEVYGRYYLAMEFVNGVDLRRLLSHARKSGWVLGIAEVAAIGEMVARGLSHAHGALDAQGQPLGLVHRDISPHNIMVSCAGDAKVMDFGIAKAGARATRTQTGIIKGKVAYMAPEQASALEIDKRVDQFALGLVLWELLAGERMFQGDSDVVLLRKVVEAEIRPLTAYRPDVVPALEAIILRALARDPEHRYSDLATWKRLSSAFVSRWALMAWSISAVESEWRWPRARPSRERCRSPRPPKESLSKTAWRRTKFRSRRCRPPFPLQPRWQQHLHGAMSGRSSYEMPCRPSSGLRVAGGGCLLV